MLRAINGLMGVISGLKLKKNEAGGVGGKREARRKCLSWGVMEHWQHHPRFHTEAKWAMVIIPGPCCVQGSPYPTDMRFGGLMLMNFVLVRLPDAFLWLCSRPI